MAAARASVADISSVSRANRFTVPAVSIKRHFRHFPRPSLVAAILFPHTKWLQKITDYRDTAALKRFRAFRERNVVLWWVGGNLGGRGACWVCARSSHRRHRAGLGLLGIVNFFAGFSLPKDPGSSVRTSGPKLTVAYNLFQAALGRSSDEHRKIPRFRPPLHLFQRSYSYGWLVGVYTVFHTSV